MASVEGARGRELDTWASGCACRADTRWSLPRAAFACKASPPEAPLQNRQRRGVRRGVARSQHLAACVARVGRPPAQRCTLGDGRCSQDHMREAQRCTQLRTSQSVMTPPAPVTIGTSGI